MSEKIGIDTFKQVEIAIGEIKTVDLIEGADKLLRLTVDFNEGEPRQILSGIRTYFEDPQVLVGKKCAFAVNLEPRTIRGLESNGMILAASTEDGVFALLEASNYDIPLGSKIK
jgi:methionyl-tRNA synthetase